MKALKSRIGGIGLTILFILVPSLTALLFVHGAAWVDEWLGRYVAATAIGLAIIDLIIILPLSIFRKLRGLCVHFLFFSSIVFMLATWFLGFESTLQYWGYLGVLLGIFVVGIGVIPFGFIAAIIHADWTIVCGLVVGIVLILAVRIIATALQISLNEKSSYNLSL
jgi:hypothetical protein